MNKIITEIVQLTDKKIVTRETEYRANKVFMRARVRMLHKRGEY